MWSHVLEKKWKAGKNTVWVCANEPSRRITRRKNPETAMEGAQFSRRMRTPLLVDPVEWPRCTVVANIAPQAVLGLAGGTDTFH